MSESITIKEQYNFLDLRKLGLIYAMYRLTIALIMTTIFFISLNDLLIGKAQPAIFAMISICYSVMSIALLMMQYQINRFKNLQHLLGLIIDITILTIMLYANGGTSVQVSLLYMVTVVAAFILLDKHQAIIVTLFAIICVVYQQLIFVFTGQIKLQGLSNMALLSLSFIGTAVLSSMMTSRLKSMEVVAEEQAFQVQKLHKMNQKILETMENGVLVIDDNTQIVSVNKAALKIFGMLKTKKNPFYLYNIDTDFSDHITKTLKSHKTDLTYIPSNDSKVQEPLLVQIYTIEDKQKLLIIENISKTQQQAQQMKLASLGRLTASIAHEIRNPIGAISQASQLLQENDDDDNLPLYTIIHKQTQRVNQIIEGVLQLSRQTDVVLQSIPLSNFLSKFLHEHFDNNNIHDNNDVELVIHNNVLIEFNPSQLEQVLLNLVNNGLTHGKNTNKKISVKIVVKSINTEVFIDVIDTGMGISSNNLEKLFEPFFTTSKTGTGLGLYLCRAFCDANGAKLNYIDSPAGSCFRIALNKKASVL